MKCRLSVRELVEFLYKSGDLVASSLSVERANLGSRIHRMLQAQAKGKYQSEVYLKLECQIEDVVFCVDGRADGILMEEDGVTVEEIKTTAIPYEEIDDRQFVHFAQAYCYAYIYALQHELSAMKILLTYYQIETKQIKQFREEKSFEELASFYEETLKGYLQWARLTQRLLLQSRQSFKQLVFPFPSYREGQRVFASGVYKTILDKSTLFAQAPTGIGKTISTLFPSLKAIGEGKTEKVFYLCAKNITASVAHAALQKLYEQKLPFISVAITAKDKLCPMEERNCDPQFCPYAKGYYERNKQALYELLDTEWFLQRDVILRYAQKYQLCPFELSLDASLYADVIVCDYNYVFDPRVYLKRFFMERGNYVFLVDEAHNLVDRARGMYSARLSESSFRQIKKQISKHAIQLQTALEKIIAEFDRLKQRLKKTAFYAQEEAISSILQPLDSFIEHCDAYLQTELKKEEEEALREVYFEAVNYLRIADLYDENFVTWISMEEDDCMLCQFCISPRNPLRAMMEKGRSTVLFSATLSPIDYYLDVLGGDEKSRLLSLSSPFPREHCRVVINQAVSTKYYDRNKSILPIIQYLYAVFLAKEGNYMVFFPSYAYMRQVGEAFIQQYPKVCVHMQKEALSEQEKEAFLERFETTSELHVFFCVLGGMFSEGIDLKGDRLIGAVLIGVGLPQVNPSQELIREHFEREKQMGFAYAYQFPGMNKVLQAAGRVIRSVQDKGVVVLIDERFAAPSYQRLLPPSLQHYRIINEPQEVFMDLSTFWEGAKKE